LTADLRIGADVGVFGSELAAAEAQIRREADDAVLFSYEPLDGGVRVIGHPWRDRHQEVADFLTSQSATGTRGSAF
jgi:hypothetical protein